jgi:hypothetical protein
MRQPLKAGCRFNARASGVLMRSSLWLLVKSGCLLSVALLATGCGGGGGSSAASAPQTGGSGSNNAAPTIQGQPGGSVLAGQAYSFQPSANDANGDTLTFTATNLPSWASLNASTGRVTGTPASVDVATYDGISIRVSDGSASATLGPFSIVVSDVGTGTAAVSWVAPTQNSDGSTLTNLAGYQVLYGRQPDDLGLSVTLNNPSLSTYMVENLSSGTWYFAVVAVNSAGAGSALSEVASKTIS